MARISGLDQFFSYGVFNNSLKVLGDTNNVQYMEWLTAEDDRVCPRCVENSQKGRGGRFDVGWFIPQIPVHRWCRCRLRLVYRDERKGHPKTPETQRLIDVRKRVEEAFDDLPVDHTRNVTRLVIRPQEEFDDPETGGYFNNSNGEISVSKDEDELYDGWVTRHEVGHAAHRRYLSDDDRDAWKAIWSENRGKFTGDGKNSPSEAFAETYARAHGPDPSDSRIYDVVRALGGEDPKSSTFEDDLRELCRGDEDLVNQVLRRLRK